MGSQSSLKELSHETERGNVISWIGLPLRMCQQGRATNFMQAPSFMFYKTVYRDLTGRNVLIVLLN